MALKSLLRKITLGLLAGIYLASFSTPVLASSFNADQTPRLHIIKFYLDPTLTADMDFVRSALSAYVDDMNFVLAKNTNRRLVFDPQTGVIPVTSKPQTDSGRPPLPVNDFEIWAYIIPSTINMSHSGYASMDKSGAAVMTGMQWVRVYNPASLDASSSLDYVRQLNVMLHEFAHIFGGGIGEYYNLAHVLDTTGTTPALNINVDDPHDAYWAKRADYMTDPLFQQVALNAVGRSDYLENVRFSALTAAIIGGEYRNGIPSFENFTVRVLDQNGNPVPSANVKVWNISGNPGNAGVLLMDAVTDGSGQVVVDFGDSLLSHNANNFLRLIKVYKDGVLWAQPQFVSIYDLDEARLVDGSEAFVLDVQQPSLLDAFSINTQDGWVLGSAKSATKTSQNSKSTTLRVGDDASNRQYVGILSFDTTLPENAMIDSVVLKVKVAKINGNSPFKTLKKLTVDIRNGNFGKAFTLEGGDFAAKATLPSGLKFSGSVKAGQWMTITFPESAYGSLNTAGVTQLKLRFSLASDGDAVADYVSFISGDATANMPELMVKYHLP